MIERLPSHDDSFSAVEGEPQSGALEGDSCSPQGVSFRCGEQYDMVVPQNVERVCREYGELNRFGEPNYRIVWGWRRLMLLEGAWKRSVPAAVIMGGIARHMMDSETIFVGAKWIQKYPNLNSYFIMERWMPPEHYGTPESWKAANDKYDEETGKHFMENGLFPSRGDYEMIWHFHNPWTKGFEHVTENMVINRIRWNLERRARTTGDVRKEANYHNDYEQKLKDQKANDVHEKNVAAFPFQKWVPITGTLPGLMPGQHR